VPVFRSEKAEARIFFSRRLFKSMYIKVKVSAGAKKESIVRISSDHFEISVKEKAERNMANKKVVEIIGDFFALSAGKVKIVSGHHSPGKILNVETEEKGT